MNFDTIISRSLRGIPKMKSSSVTSIAISLLVFMSLQLIADDHTSDNRVAEFHYFNVNDPAAFVSAMDTHNASECAEQWQSQSKATVLLSMVTGSDVSHMVYVGYPNYESMELGRELFASCSETAQMLSSFGDATYVGSYHNVIFEEIISINSDQPQKHYAKFDIKIGAGQESAYTEKWLAFMQSQEKHLSESHYGVNRIVFGAGDVSHYAYIGGKSLTGLMTTMNTVLSSPDYSKFSKSVGNYRVVVQNTLIDIVKAFPVER